MPPFDSKPATFDPGICHEPFVTLGAQSPDQSVYPVGTSGSSGGPIFYRGRLDRRSRPREKRGYRPSYSDRGGRSSSTRVFGHARVRSQLRYDQHLPRQRLQSESGGPMCGCGWREFTNSNRVAAALPHQHVLHATSPESGNSTPQPIKATMLAKWNSALESLRQAVQHPDAVRPFVPYGADFRPTSWLIFRRLTCPPGSRLGCAAPTGGRPASGLRLRRTAGGYRPKC